VSSDTILWTEISVTMESNDSISRFCTCDRCSKTKVTLGHITTGSLFQWANFEIV
jgi:hypothetical protein